MRGTFMLEEDKRGEKKRLCFYLSPIYSLGTRPPDALDAISQLMGKPIVYQIRDYVYPLE